MKIKLLIIILTCFNVASYAQSQIVCNQYWYDDIEVPEYDFKNYESRTLHKKYNSFVRSFPVQQIWSINNAKFLLSSKTLRDIPQNARMLFKLDNGAVIEAVRQQIPVSIQDTASVFYSLPQIKQLASRKITKIRVEYLYLSYKDYKIDPQEQDWLLQGFRNALQHLKQQFDMKTKLKNNFSTGF